MSQLPGQKLPSHKRLRVVTPKLHCVEHVDH